MDGGRAMLILALLTTVALAGCSTTGEAITIERPEWKSGYAWSYAFSEEFAGESNENGEADNFTGGDEGRFVREVLNTTIQANGEPVYVLMRDSTERGPRIEVFKQEDFSYVPFGWSFMSSCNNTSCTGTMDLEFYEDEGPEWPPFLDFPLTTGKTWGGVVDISEYTGDEDEAFSITVAATVEGAARVELPVGVTEAAKITRIIRPTNMQEFEQAIKAEGEAEGYRVDAIDIESEARETIYFSDQYKTVVQSSVVDEETFFARGTDPDGEPFEYRNHFTYTRTEVLDGARLGALPERSIDEAVPFLNREVTLEDPSGKGVIDAGYTLSIDPVGATINAGAGETVGYSVDVEGETMPANHTLHWRLVDPAGRVIQEATGNEFTAAPTKPGRFSVSVEARQDDALVTADSGDLVADWIATETVACSEVTVLGVPACDDGSVPVYPGIRSLVVRATPTGPLGALPGSSMRLYDSEGQMIVGQPDGDGYTVEVTDFTWLYLDGWTMEYRHSAGVLSDVEMEIEAIYGNAPAVEAEQTRYGLDLELPW